MLSSLPLYHVNGQCVATVSPIIAGGSIVLLTLLGCRLMGWYRRRWPQHGRLAAVAFVFVVATLFDLPCEIYWMKLGLYNYPNLPLALFSNHYYRVPLHEIPFTGMWYTGIVIFIFIVVHVRPDVPSLMIVQSWPGLRRRLVSQPSLMFAARPGMIKL